MKNSYIVLILFFLSGCSQKTFYDDKHSSNHYQTLREIERLQAEGKIFERYIELDLANGENLKRVIEKLENDLEIIGNNKIGKVNISYRKSSFNNIRHKSDIEDNKQSSFEKDEVPIKSHSYITITSIDELKKLNNTSTYIVFSRNLKGQDKHTKKYKRYAKVLDLIQELKKIKEYSQDTENFRTKHENKFIIMRDKLSFEKITVESYNYELANQILDFFKAIVSPSFFDKEGPFFITVTENIFDLNKEFSFLYVDLSTFNDSAIEQVLDSYKNRLIEKGDEDIDMIEGWHYWLLSALTNFNNDIQIFQRVFAGEN